MENTDLWTSFVNWQTILICLGCYLITYMIRTVVESIWISIKGNRFWNEIFLPLGPIVNGGLMALAIYPAPLTNSLLAKILYGGVCGLFSGYVYSRVRSWVSSGQIKVGTNGSLS